MQFFVFYNNAGLNNFGSFKILIFCVWFVKFHSNSITVQKLKHLKKDNKLNIMHNVCYSIKLNAIHTLKFLYTF